MCVCRLGRAMEEVQRQTDSVPQDFYHLRVELQVSHCVYLILSQSDSHHCIFTDIKSGQI